MTYPFTHGMVIPLEGSGQTVAFQWNPEQIDGPDAKADWEAIPTAGAKIPGVEYSAGGVPHIQFDIALSRDNSDQDVDSMVKSLQRLTDPTVKGRGKDRPPRLKLILGDRRWTCVLLEANPHYHKFFHPITLQPYFAKIGLLFWVVQ